MPKVKQRNSYDRKPFHTLSRKQKWVRLKKNAKDLDINSGKSFATHAVRNFNMKHFTSLNTRTSSNDFKTSPDVSNGGTKRTHFSCPKLSKENDFFLNKSNSFSEKSQQFSNNNKKRKHFTSPKLSKETNSFLEQTNSFLDVSKQLSDEEILLSDGNDQLFKKNLKIFDKCEKQHCATTLIREWVLDEVNVPKPAVTRLLNKFFELVRIKIIVH